MLLKSVKHVGQCYRFFRNLLRCNNVDEPESSTNYIMAHVLRKKTLHNVHPKTQVSHTQWMNMKQLITKRLHGEPVQYILGEWDFCGLVLDMKPPVLIPRPETEELVGHVLEARTSFQNDHSCFLDIGCGTGAISLALLQRNESLKGIAIDINRVACDLTVQNAQKHNLLDRLQVHNMPVSDIFNRLPGKQFDFVISNPPYIDTADMKNLPSEIKNYEDEVALHGGADGLYVINQILQVAPLIVKPKGHIWLEVDSKHPSIISSTAWSGLMYLNTFKDFRGQPRFCQLQRK